MRNLTNVARQTNYRRLIMQLALMSLNCLSVVVFAQEKSSVPISASVGASVIRPQMVFVDAGKPKDVKVIGAKWVEKDGWLMCKGGGSPSDRLATNMSIGPGDFSVKARLAIFGLARSAASFRFDRDNQAIYGFEGNHGFMYVAGSFYGTDSITGKICPSAKYIKDGKPFNLEINREGDQLRILIDGRLVRQQTVSVGEVGVAHFVPVRSTMRIESFSVTANFLPPGSKKPKNISEVNCITIHPIVKEMPGLKLGPFVRLADGGILTAEKQSAFVTYDDGTALLDDRAVAKGIPLEALKMNG